jgi:radical SAM protein with 4Fe4S-binding SPASM domain
VTDTLQRDEISHLLTRYSESGVFIVRFTGKEPTAHPDFLDIVREGKKLGLKMALNTNGVFYASYRKELVKAGVSEVVVSLDGNQETNDYIRGKGVYEQATSNIRGFVEDGVDTRINMTVSRKNMDQIEHIARFAHLSGAYVSYIPMRNLGNATQRMKKEALDGPDMRQIATEITGLRSRYSPTRLLTYFDVIGEKSDYYHPMFQMKPCHARKNIFIDNVGDVYPCDHLVNLGDLFRGGNIRDNDVLYIWKQGKGLERYRNLEHNEECMGCTFFGKQCHGGCPSEYLNEKGANTQIVMDRLCFTD